MNKKRIHGKIAASSLRVHNKLHSGGEKMIAGVGIDLAEINRIKELLERQDNFLSSFFTGLERDYILSVPAKKNERAAGIFAAKEAFSKAVGTGIFKLYVKEIEVRHEEGGRPYIILLGGLSEKYGNLTFHLSISHTKDNATAIVLAERL